LDSFARGSRLINFYPSNPRMSPRSGCAFTEAGGGIYRNWVCAEYLPIYMWDIVEEPGYFYKFSVAFAPKSMGFLLVLLHSMFST